jgi:hypothetical protein
LPLAIYYFDFDFFRRLSFFAIFIDFRPAFSFAISMLRFSLILTTFSLRLQSFFRRFRRFRAMPPFSSFDAAADVFDFSALFFDAALRCHFDAISARRLQALLRCHFFHFHFDYAILRLSMIILL